MSSTWATRSAHNSVSFQSQKYRAPTGVARSQDFSYFNKEIYFRGLFLFLDPPLRYWLPLKHC